ncbi:MAG: hypothetical protein ACKO85_01555, partial [Isosphaeraceae bacterium]
MAFSLEYRFTTKPSLIFQHFRKSWLHDELAIFHQKSTFRPSAVRSEKIHNLAVFSHINSLS